MNTSNQTNAVVLEEQLPLNLNELLAGLSEVKTHPHLAKFEIKANGALQGANNELYIPLKDASGKLVTLQRINQDGSCELLEGKPQTGGYLTLQGDSSLVLLAKSHATTAAMHEATGYTTVMYATCDNLNSVIEDIRASYPDTPMMLCCDRDAEQEKELAIALGLTVVKPKEGQALSLTSFRKSQGDKQLKSYVDSFIEYANLRIPEGYELTPEGLFVWKDGKDGVARRLKVCENLRVTSLLRDKNSDNWGLVVEVKDPDDNFHEVVLSRKHLTGSHSKYLDMLVPKGLLVEDKRTPELRTYLQRVKPISRTTSVPSLGWFDNQYVFPDEVIGEGQDRLILQCDDESMCDTSCSGNVLAWKKNVSEYCRGNSRLLFAVSAAFSPIIKSITNSENTGIHFNGTSSCGKTTLLEVAKSVWGNPQYLPRWKATNNGLETLASHHNDSLFVLDEIAQLSSKDIGDAVYMIGNGKGKQRMTGSKKPLSWRTTLLSTGEVSLEQHISTAGKKVTAGQEVRFIDVYAPVSEDDGVFNTTHEYPDGREFSDVLKANSKRHYGVASRKMIELVIKHHEESRLFVDQVMREFTQSVVPEGAAGQVYRVAGHLSEIAAAGELASKMMITGWKSGEAFEATKSIFEEWLVNRGTTGALEEQQILSAIRERLSSRGDMWFHTEDKSAARNGKCYGIKDDNMFYVEQDAFKYTFCQDFDHKVAANILLRRGFLIPDYEGKLAKGKTVNKTSRRYYHIRSSIMADE